MSLKALRVEAGMEGAGVVLSEFEDFASGGRQTLRAETPTLFSTGSMQSLLREF